MIRVVIMQSFDVEPVKVELRDISQESVKDINDEYGKKPLRKVSNTTMVGMIDLRGRAVSSIDPTSDYTYTATVGDKPQDALVIHADRSLVCSFCSFDCRVNGILKMVRFRTTS